MSISLTRDKSEQRAGTSAEFEAHLARTHRQALNLAYRLTSNQAEAEDLVQESYLRAFRFFHRYDSSLPFISWLYRIITNAHVDALRRRNKLKTTSLDQPWAEGTSAWDIADTKPLADRAMLDRTMAEPIQRALSSMTPEFRTAVILADVEGMAYEEIAEIMETSVGTVRSRIHRGRKQLRSHLERTAPQLVAAMVVEDEL